MDLPEEMWFEILLHLPVKSLLLLQSVCKSWCALIKSPQFKAVYLSRARNNGALLLKLPPQKNTNPSASYYVHSNLESVRGATSSPDLRYMPFSRHPGFSCQATVIICHCNGIICLTDRKDMYLVNPAIQEVRILPRLPKSSLFAPYLGFGYDPNADDYKVVLLDDDLAKVYSLNTDSWRDIDVDFTPFPAPLADRQIFQVFFNGRMHWSASMFEFDPTSSRVFERKRRKIVLFSFDMSTQVVKEIALPDSIRSQRANPPRLDVLRESLALIYHRYIGQRQECLDVWVMMEYGVEETWTRMYSIGPGFDYVFSLCFWKDELLLHRRVWKDELLLHRRVGERQLVLTLISLAAGHELQTFDGFGEYDYCVEAIAYKESWISIKR